MRDVAKDKLTFRCSRLKDNFSIIKEEDRPHLLVAKDEVETSMAREKWMLIAEMVKNKGGDSYSVGRILLSAIDDPRVAANTFSARATAAPVEEAHGQGGFPSAARRRGSRLRHPHL